MLEMLGNTEYLLMKAEKRKDQEVRCALVRPLSYIKIEHDELHKFIFNSWDRFYIMYPLPYIAD